MAVNDYCTTAEVKAQTPDLTWGATYDTLFGYLITRASRFIDSHCGREDGAFYVTAAASERTYDGSGETWQYIDECCETPTTVKVKDSYTDETWDTWTSDDWKAASGAREDPDYNTTPYTFLLIDPAAGDEDLFTGGFQAVKVTAKWGYSTTTPDLVKQSTIIQVLRWFKRAQQMYHDVGAISELGQLMYVKDLDPDIKMSLSNRYVAGLYG